MIFTINNFDNASSGLPFEAILEHNGHTINWKLTPLGRSTIRSPAIFNQLNIYVGLFTDEVRDNLFELYKDAYEIIYNNSDQHSKHTQLTNKLNEILKYFDYDSLVKWCSYNPILPVPHNFDNTYVENIDKFTTRDRTYTKPDYVELLAMTIGLRSILPIWTEYLEIAVNFVGKKHKEDYVFKTISKNFYYTCPAMLKLTRYIEASTKGLSETKESILNGISSEDFINIMLAIVVIRRVCVADLGDSSVSHNLVTYLFKFIDQKKKEIEDSNKANTKPKDANEGSGDKKDKLSNLELFKIKEETSIGDLVCIEKSFSDFNKIIASVSPDIDVELLKNSIRTSSALSSLPLYDTQITMLQWFYKNIITPKSFMHLPKPTIVMLIALAEATLLQNELYFPAILISMTPIRNKETLTTESGSRARLTAEILTKLNELFPFNKVVRMNGREKKNINYAVEAIDLMVEKLVEVPWKSTMGINTFRQITGSTSANNTRFLIPHTIKLDLANLIIFSSKIGSQK